jgi:hypothetical protein
MTGIPLAHPESGPVPAPARAVRYIETLPTATGSATPFGAPDALSACVRGANRG